MEPFEIPEEQDFTSQRSAEGAAAFTIFSTLAFMPLSGQILSKKNC